MSACMRQRDLCDQKSKNWIGRTGIAMKYELKNEELQVEFQSFGGSLSSIKDSRGTEFLWQGDKTYWSGQAPVLFPICGSIRENKALTRSGRTLHMPRHGIVRKREFDCTQQTENSITFSIKSNEEMEEAYPFSFELLQRYTLSGRRIRTEYLVKNTGADPMPFQIGGHPGFCCPLYEGEDYSDYSIEFEKEETTSVPDPVVETGLIDMGKRTQILDHEKSLTLQHDLFHKDALIFDQLQSRKVTLVSKKHGKQLSLEFVDFPYLLLWSSANDGPFIALEPWHGLSTCSDESDIFDEKRGMIFAQASEEKSYYFDIIIE